MPTNASILADYASGIGTQGTTLTIDGDLKRVGIGTTLPTSTLDVNGDVNVTGQINVTDEVYATQFFGNVIGDISGDVTGNADTATYATTAGIATYADVAGIATYATTAGIATYADVAGIATVAENLTGNPTISVTDITATGNVSIAGTLTYEDVTNVDSIGIITAQSGIDVTGGGINVGTATTITDGGINVTGVITATSFSGDGSNLTGLGTFSGNYNDLTNTPSIASQAEAVAGTNNTNLMTPLRVKQAIDALGGSVINSIQRGVITTSASDTNTATISSVNTSKTMVNHLGGTTFVASSQTNDMTRLTLTNSTTVTLIRSTTSGGSTTHYEVIEFV